MSGLPVILNCQLQTEGPDDDPIVYTWTKEDGSLPEGSSQEANGEWEYVSSLVLRLQFLSLKSYHIESPSPPPPSLYLSLSFSLFLPSKGILLIPSAQEEDSGVYFCSANGVTGRFVINIEDPPEDPTSPPNDPGTLM